MSIRAADEKTELLLLDYLDGTLDPAKRVELETYLQSHPRERQVLDDLRAQRDRLMRVPAERAPPEIYESAQGHLERAALLDHFSDQTPIVAGRRAGPQWLSLAAVLVLGTGLAGALYFVLAPEGPKTDYATAGRALSEREKVVPSAAPAGEATANRSVPSAAAEVAKAPGPDTASGSNFGATPAGPGGDRKELALGDTPGTTVPPSAEMMAIREVVILTADPVEARAQVETLLRSGGWTFAEVTPELQAQLKPGMSDSLQREAEVQRTMQSMDRDSAAVPRRPDDVAGGEPNTGVVPDSQAGAAAATTAPALPASAMPGRPVGTPGPVATTAPADAPAPAAAASSEPNPPRTETTRPAESADDAKFQRRADPMLPVEAQLPPGLTVRVESDQADAVVAMLTRIGQAEVPAPSQALSQDLRQGMGQSNLSNLQNAAPELSRRPELGDPRGRSYAASPETPGGVRSDERQRTQMVRLVVRFERIPAGTTGNPTDPTTREVGAESGVGGTPLPATRPAGQ